MEAFFQLNGCGNVGDWPLGAQVLDQPGADEVEGFAFPGLLLAAVLGQLAGPEADPEGAKAAVGVDRGQLPVITDQDHLGAGRPAAGQASYPP